MVPDVTTGDSTRKLCFKCARRIVSPPVSGKYDPLRRYLRFRAAFTSVVRLSFARIDGIIGDNLPMTAFRNKKWWSGPSSSAHVKAWLDAGWRIQEVDLGEGYVVFRKMKGSQARNAGKRRLRKKVKKPFTPAPYRAPRARKTSKTRASKLHARLKNLERRRASITKYRGSFKPKPAQEKKLYKPEEKPK